VYEESKSELREMGFSGEQAGGYEPVYDPLLSAVVCVRELAE
jgi:hypothetical protein